MECAANNIGQDPEKEGTAEEFGITCPLCQTTTPIDEETVHNIIMLVEENVGAEGMEEEEEAQLEEGDEEEGEEEYVEGEGEGEEEEEMEPGEEEDYDDQQYQFLDEEEALEEDDQ